MTETTPAIEAATALGLTFDVVRIGKVRSLAEAAAAQGVAPRDIVKTLVVRRGEGDHLLVLVPGDREISWPKLRALLGVSRLSMPDADVAREVTGYERGTITPFGTRQPLEVVADESLADDGRVVSIGGGAHGVSLRLPAAEVIRSTEARVADVTDVVGG